MTGATIGSLLVAVTGPIGLPTTVASPSETDMLLTLTVDDAPMAPDLEAFLRQRAIDTWNAEVVRGGATDSPAASPDSRRHFRVGITWPAERSVEVRIAERQAVLVERILVVTDPGAAKLTVWLLVKSTIKRELKYAATGDAAPVATKAASAELDPQPEPMPAVSAPAGEIAAPPAPSELPAVRPWSFAALMTFSVGSSRLFSVGPGIGARYRPWRRLQLGTEVGYRLAPGVVGLIIHHVPLRVDAGWALGSKRSVTVGAAATVDLKIPVATYRARAVVGIDAGPFLELRMPLSRSGVGITLRSTFCLRAVRQRYVVENGDVPEAPWDVTLTTGVVWP